MAYTATSLYKTVWGNKRVVSFDVTSDAASGSVTTGLSVIESVTLGPVSMNTAGVKLKKNLSEASATANGTLFVSSTTSGDNFIVVCVGK